jgi:hypothetical protein
VVIFGVVLVAAACERNYNGPAIRLLQRKSPLLTLRKPVDKLIDIF